LDKSLRRITLKGEKKKGGKDSVGRSPQEGGKKEKGKEKGR